MPTPTVTPTRIEWLSMVMSLSNAAHSRSASASAEAGCGPVGVMMVNSSPPTRARNAPWQTCSMRAGHFAQQRVADRMAEHVIDRLEAVEIDAQHGEIFARRRRAFKRCIDAFVERRPVRQVGERIVMRHMRDALFASLEIGDVVNDADKIFRLAIRALTGSRVAVTIRVPLPGVLTLCSSMEADLARLDRFSVFGQNRIGNGLRQEYRRLFYR